jgi:hypothetical protein
MVFTMLLWVISTVFDKPLVIEAAGPKKVAVSACPCERFALSRSLGLARVDWNLAGGDSESIG